MCHWMHSGRCYYCFESVEIFGLFTNFGVVANTASSEIMGILA